LILCNAGIMNKGETMKKDFSITAEVRLIAHWNTPMYSPEEWDRRKAVNDRLGVIACDLDKTVNELVEGLLAGE
jgi:hypothetical protein